MVVFDFSTITLAAVSSFPSQVIASSTTLKESMQTEIAKNNILWKWPNKGVVINAFSDDFLKNNSTDTIWKEEELSEVKTTNTTIVDDLQPKPDNLGKPLLYLWFTAFNTLDYLGNINLDDTDCVTFFTKIFVNILFSSWITILYSLSLLVFVIILVMRLAYLWIIIWTIPIIILLKIVDSSKIVNISKISSFFDIGKILKLIFQPVIFWFWISLMFLFVIVFQKFMIVSSWTFESWDIIFEQNKVTGENLSQNGKTDSLYNSKLQISNIFKMTIYQWIRWIQSFILALVTLVLLWYFIKIAVSTSTSNTMPWLENFANTVVGWMERTIWNMWVVPTPKWTLSLNQLYDNGRSPLMGAVVNDYTSKLQEKDRKRKDEVLNMLWFSTDNDPGLVTDNIKSALKESVKREKGPEEFVKEVGRIRGGVRFSTIKPYIPDWFLTTWNGNETGTYWKTRFWENDWNNIKTQFKGFETMKPEEKEAAFVKAFTWEVIKNFLKIFGYKSGNIKSYNDLQNAIIKGTSSQTS